MAGYPLALSPKKAGTAGRRGRHHQAITSCDIQTGRLLRVHRFAALLASAFFCLAAQAADYDLILRNARIIDGTGSPARPGDVAVKGPRIAAVGKVTGTADREIDVQGQVVAPGFIDVHTHCERCVMLPAMENYIRMGVTTVVTGNCGVSRTDLPKFFAEIKAARVATNMLTLVGHNTVRRQVMGGDFPRDPSPAEMEEMKRVVDQAMRDGAAGLSTGLIYLPGSYAKTGEILELAKVASAYDGLYTSHMRSENLQIFDALDELFTIAREAKMRAQVSHLKLSAPASWGQAGKVLAKLDQARAEGLDIAHDQYLYTSSAVGLELLIPQKARAGKIEDFQKLLADPTRKAALLAEMKDTLQKRGHTDYAYVSIAKFDAEPALNGKTIAEVAKLKYGSDALTDQMEVIFDVQIRGGGSGRYHVISEEDLAAFLRHPLTMIASDGVPRLPGVDAPHPRSFGNNARAINRYVREQNVLSLEEAIRRMTSLPAKTFRLSARGELKPGNFADIVVFDPEKVRDVATFADPHHYAEGFSEVIVNGGLTLHEGEPTGQRSGLPLRFQDEKKAPPSAGG